MCERRECCEGSCEGNVVVKQGIGLGMCERRKYWAKAAAAVAVFQLGKEAVSARGHCAKRNKGNT